MEEKLDIKDIDPYFVSLVLSLSATAMAQMGKTMNPATGKVEKNLEQAKVTIDTLNTIKKKTAGNLSKKEEELLTHTLADLQLNFVDESKKEGGDETVH